MLQSTYIQPFKSEIQIINHWIAISGHKHGFCSIRPHGFLGAVEYVLFGRETKIPCDSSVAGISQTLRRRHVLRHAFCMLTSVFLAERNEAKKIRFGVLSLTRNAYRAIVESRFWDPVICSNKHIDYNCSFIYCQAKLG